MSLKDRFNLKDNNFVEIKNEADIFDIFIRKNKSENIITSALNKYQNILVAGSIECDKTIMSQYIKNFIPKIDSVEVIYNVNSEINYINAQRIIVPEANIHDFIKVLEMCLYGFKSFITTLNIKSYNHIIDTLKTLIALNTSNLQEAGINNLLGTAELLIIYIAKNSDGLFYIQNIGTIDYNNSEINLIDLYTSENNNVEEGQKAPEETEKIEYYIQDNVIEPSDIEIKNDSDIIEQSVENIIEVEETKNLTGENKPVKVNKYKLLKEKLKNKKDENKII